MQIDEKELKKAIQEFNLKRYRSLHAVEMEEDLLLKFQARWPKDKLKDLLTIESYCIGVGDKDNFCYWIERKTRLLGSILGAAVKKFKVYYSKKSKKYECVNEFKSPEEAFIRTKQSILDLLAAAERNDDEAVKNIDLLRSSNLVRGKILFLYYPDKYINIFSEEDIEFILAKFGIFFSPNDHVLDKQRLLIDFKNKHPEMRAWSNMKFGKFLCSGWVVLPSRKSQKSFQEKEKQVLDVQVNVDYFVLEKYFDVFKKFVEKNDQSPLMSFSNSKYLNDQEGYKSSIFKGAQTKLNSRSWEADRIGKGDIVQAVILAIEQSNNNLLLHNNSKGEAAREDRLLYEVRKNQKKLFLVEETLYKFYRDENIQDEEAFNELKTLGATYPLIAFLFFIKNKNKYLSLAPMNFDGVFKKLQIKFSTYKKCSWENYQQYLLIVEESKKFLEEKLEEHVSLLDAHSFLWMLRKLEADIKISEEDINQAPMEELKLEKLPPQRRESDGLDGDSKDGPYNPKRNTENKLIGDKAETFVVQSEKEFLIKAGRPDLAEKVEQVSKKKDCGYDVLSFERNNKEKHIEVKGTTSPKPNGSFIITQNELRHSGARGEYNFYLYIVYDVNGRMKTKYIKNPNFRDTSLFTLRPTQYRVGYLATRE